MAENTLLKRTDEATLDQFEKFATQFNANFVRKAREPIDWPQVLKEYLVEVKKSLEATTHKTKKSLLGSWVKRLNNEQPTNLALNSYLNEKYAKNTGSRNRVGRDIVLFSNRYLTIASKPPVSQLAALLLTRMLSTHGLTAPCLLRFNW